PDALPILRYVLDDKIKDALVDGVYLDRGVSVWLRPGEALSLQRLPDMQTTRVALLTAVQGDARPENGAVLGRLELYDGSGGARSLPLRAGWETASAV